MTRQLLKFLFLILSFTSVFAHAEPHNIADNPDNVKPILNGQTVPNSTLYQLDEKAVKLHDIIKNKPTVIVFYRGGWCPYCNAQLAGLKEVESKIMDLGYQLIAISPDSPAKLKKQAFEIQQKIQLMSDTHFETIEDFGLGFFLDEKTSDIYRNKFGIEFVDLDGTSKVALPVPAIYIVDQKGLVHFQYVNPNFKVRLAPELLYQAAKITNLGK